MLKMIKPSEEKSQKSHQLINQLFLEKVENPSKYIVAYTNYTKRGIFTQKMYNYVIGFSVEDKEIIVIPVNSDVTESDDVILLKKENIRSAKYGLQGDVKIKSDILEKDLRFIVPPFTTKISEAVYFLPIIQEDIASQFKNFIKENF